MAITTQVSGHLPRAIPGRLQELRIDQPHQRQVLRRLADRLVIERRPADRNQLALPNNGQPPVARLNQRPSPLHTHRPDAFAKKSRSTTNCPILACSFSTSSSRMPSFASPLPENTATSPSTACRFHSPTIVWCTPCLLANCEVVSSPRNASIATLALNSAE